MDSMIQYISGFSQIFSIYGFVFGLGFINGAINLPVSFSSAFMIICILSLPNFYSELYCFCLLTSH